MKDRKYISVVEEEKYFEEIYNKMVAESESIFLTPNYAPLFRTVTENKDDGIKSELDTLFGIDEEVEEVIKKVASFDMASGGLLPMPEMGESVNVRFLHGPYCMFGRIYMTRIAIYGREYDLQYDFFFSGTIYKGILAEMMKAKIPVDKDLRCIVNRVFTIAGRQWVQAPKELWRQDEVTKRMVAPKTYAVALRMDLEARPPDTVNDDDDFKNIRSF